MGPADRFSPLLVTGASGFVGACLTRRALAAGFEVHVVLRSEAAGWRLEGVLDRLRVHHVDLTDAAAVMDLLGEIRPRAVWHLAAHGAYEWQDDGRRILQANVLGAFNLLEAAVGAQARVVVAAGSSSEYGFRDSPMSEEDRLAPNSVYAVGKAAQAHLVSLMGARAGAPAMVSLRLFSVYGPWEDPRRLIPTLIRRARAGLPLEMAARETARDFVYVDDVADAFLALDRLCELGGEVLNVGSGVQSTLVDVTAAVRDALGREVEVHWGAMAPRRWDTACWQADPERAARLLNWRARHSLREGIARTVEWVQASGDRDVA